MASKAQEQIKKIGRQVEKHAGAQTRVKVMEGHETIGSSAKPEKLALWVKGAIDRLDQLTSKATREGIMLECGYDCCRVNPTPTRTARARRRKFASEEAFLEAEVRKPPAGFRFERKGRLLFQFYTPRSFGRGMRCYCSLMRGLPEGETASPTYCQCSRGFVERYWEAILGRPVRVDLGETAISGSDECRFIVHL
jgi:hypothetical protein